MKLNILAILSLVYLSFAAQFLENPEEQKLGKEDKYKDAPEKIYNAALQFVGKQYSFGSTGLPGKGKKMPRDAFNDCDDRKVLGYGDGAIISDIFKKQFKAGIPSVPYNIYTYAKSKKKLGSVNGIEKGDIVFFNDDAARVRRDTLYGAAIYLGDGKILYPGYHYTNCGPSYYKVMELKKVPDRDCIHDEAARLHGTSGPVDPEDIDDE